MPGVVDGSALDLRGVRDIHLRGNFATPYLNSHFNALHPWLVKTPHIEIAT